MQSLTTIRENAHGTPKTTSGISSMELMSESVSITCWNTDLLLTAEVAHFHEASRLFFIYQEEVRKIEERMWEAGQLKDASTHKLEGANTLDRIEAAVEELDCRAVPWQVHTEHGHST